MSIYYDKFSSLTEEQLYDKLSKLTKQYHFYSYMGNSDAMRSIQEMSEAINTILYDKYETDWFEKYHKPGTVIDTGEKKEDKQDDKPKAKRRRDLFN